MGISESEDRLRHVHIRSPSRGVPGTYQRQKSLPSQAEHSEMDLGVLSARSIADNISVCETDKMRSSTEPAERCSG